MSAKPSDNGVVNQAQDQEQDSQDVGFSASPDNMTEASDEDDHGEDDGVGNDGSVAAENGQATESEEYGSEEGVTDEEDEEDEDEDEDEEPALKYERLGGISYQLLQKDSASALAYANQHLVRPLTWLVSNRLGLTYFARLSGHTEGNCTSSTWRASPSSHSQHILRLSSTFRWILQAIG